jgi:hypothetical protein
VSVPVVAVNVALAEFCGTVTLAGTVRPVELVAKPTVTAPTVDAALRLTVHVAAEPEESEVGEHASDVSVKGFVTAMLPPVVEMARPFPAKDAPIAPTTPIDVAPAPGEREIHTTARLPSEIVFAFIPLARHVYNPAVPAQLMVLPDAVSAAPGTTEILVTLAAG